MKKVSVVIPNFNGKRLLERNLPKVLKACRAWNNKSWEIIIVDDGSTDDSVKFLKNKYPAIKIVRHERPKRFAAACNSGVKAARGKIIVLLNNDVVPERNFLKPLLKNFENPRVFAVGCKEKSIKNGKIVYSGRAEGKFEKGFLVHWRAKNQNKKDTLWAAGGSMAVNRKKWLVIGGMDTLYRPAYWEDIDLSYRALKRGWEVLFEPKAQVFHQHETTNLNALGKRQMLISSCKNQFLFVWKNITDCKLLLAHFLWLPYHLLSSILSGDWLFLIGFLSALRQSGEAIRSRQKAKKFFKLSDKEALSRFNTGRFY